MLTISVYNECGYCTRAHTNILKTVDKQPAVAVDAIVAGNPTGHAKPISCSLRCAR